MPIKPEHRHHYRTDAWREAARIVRERAGGRCEQCQVKNHAVGYRDNRGEFTETDTLGAAEEATAEGRKLIRIVLTVAHIDGDGHTGVHDPARMQHLCQRCHNRLDAAQRQENAAETRAAKRRAAEDPRQQRIKTEPYDPAKIYPWPPGTIGRGKMPQPRRDE